ncbi:hypothetical protein [Nonomuraea sediminis]|uniref:hypothetical protein n=1 Tax=Nonomuraea sediminis TaxID=2835864 RepID=UPI001BDCF8F9|nr:hypothetical protein [Nonomuraea sediminis]
MIPTQHDLDPCPAGCGAAVLWTTTEHGRPMAIDPTPDERGNQAVYRDGPGRWRSRSLDGADARPPDPWESTYRPHVATCTNHQPPLPGIGGRRRTRHAPPRRVWR